MQFTPIWSPCGHQKGKREVSGVEKKIKISKASVDAAKPREKRYTLWDSTLGGFGLVVAPTGLKSFVLRYRAKHKFAPKQFVSLGRYGVVTPDEARRKAIALLGQVANGDDPAFEGQHAKRTAVTPGEVCDRFLRDHVKAKRKRATYALYNHAIESRIRPAFGNRHILKVSKQEVAQFHVGMLDKAVTANRCIAVLAAIYSWAGRTGIIAEGFNPATRIEKFKETPKDRYLTMSEITRLGSALKHAEEFGFEYAFDPSKPKAKHGAKPGERQVFFSPHAIAAIRLLMLTGCRRGEILNLRWKEVDLERGMLHLPDSKTGRKVVLLGESAISIIKSLPRLGEYVIVGADPDKPRVDLKRPWDAIKEKADLKDLRLHDLRHSFASVGAGAGLGLPIIGKLLGHTQSRTTERYAHLADDPLRRAAIEISGQISRAMGS
jgi:integrase